MNRDNTRYQLFWEVAVSLFWGRPWCSSVRLHPELTLLVHDLTIRLGHFDPGDCFIWFSNMWWSQFQLNSKNLPEIYVLTDCHVVLWNVRILWSIPQNNHWYNSPEAGKRSAVWLWALPPPEWRSRPSEVYLLIFWEMRTMPSKGSDLKSDELQ